jgi:hypothetical protein
MNNREAIAELGRIEKTVMGLRTCNALRKGIAALESAKEEEQEIALGEVCICWMNNFPGRKRFLFHSNFNLVDGGNIWSISNWDNVVPTGQTVDLDAIDKVRSEF